METYRLTWENTAGSPCETEIRADSAEQAAFLLGRNIGRDDASRAVLRSVRPAGDGQRWADHFTPDEVDALIVTAADLHGSAGDPNDVLSARQRELATRAYDLLNGS